MAAESSGVSLNSGFYLKNFYRYNRSAISTADRKEFSTTELSYEDTRALKRALSKLRDFDFDDSDNETNLRSTIVAFVETYNHTIASTSGKDSDTYRLNRQLKELTNKYADKLEDAGIRLQEDGTMKISNTLFEGATVSEMKDVFHPDGKYIRDMKRITTRMHNEAHDEVYAMLTGCGGKLNIYL